MKNGRRDCVHDGFMSSQRPTVPTVSSRTSACAMFTSHCMVSKRKRQMTSFRLIAHRFSPNGVHRTSTGLSFGFDRHRPHLSLYSRSCNPGVRLGDFKSLVNMVPLFVCSRFGEDTDHYSHSSPLSQSFLLFC